MTVGTVKMGKTRPAADQHTGAVLRDALTAHGVSHRVGGMACERGWLATTGHDGATVYVTAHNFRLHMGYDLDRSDFIGYTAVITEETGTRFVYCGIDDDIQRTPEACAEACARTLAAFLGLAPIQ